MKIYVPEINNYKCYYVYSEGVIRAYEQTPQANRTINYRDYYIDSNYIYRDGSISFSSYSTLPTCLSSDVITDNVYYRNDFDKILVIFIILMIICFYFPYKVMSRLFGKWLKL